VTYGKVEEERVRRPAVARKHGREDGAVMNRGGLLTDACRWRSSQLRSSAICVREEGVRWSTPGMKAAMKVMLTERRRRAASDRCYRDTSGILCWNSPTLIVGEGWTN
jgi:hypothetical protein